MSHPNTNPSPSTSTSENNNSPQGNITSPLLSHFALGSKPLGTGGFGCVFRADQVEFETNKFNVYNLSWNEESSVIEPDLESTFALKLIPQGELSEVKFMSKLCHPNIVACYNVWAEEDCEEIGNLLKSLPSDLLPDDSYPSVQIRRAKHTPYRIPTLLVMQMEYCTEGTLHDWIILENNHGMRRGIFSQLVQALVYLQIKNLVHGDVKLSNVLLTRCKKSGGKLVAKLADFGLTGSYRRTICTTKGFGEEEEDEELSGEEDEDEELSGEEMDKEIQNRRLFLPPEVAKLEVFQKSGQIVVGANHKSDIYSLGLVWICLLCPFTTLGELKDTVFSAMAPSDERKLPESLQSDAKLGEIELITKMLDWDVNIRPSGKEIARFLESEEDYCEGGENEVDLKIRIEIEKSLEVYETLKTWDAENPIIALILKQKHRFLTEIVEKVVKYISPRDDLFVRAMNAYNQCDDDCFGWDVGDGLYWLEKLGNKCDLFLPPDFDSVEIMKLRSIVAAAKCDIGDEEEKLEGIEELEKILLSPTIQKLEPVDPLRVKCQCLVWTFKYCDTFLQNGKQQELPDHHRNVLVSILAQAELVLATLTNVKEHKFPLLDPKAMGMLNVVVNILAKLEFLLTGQAERRRLSQNFYNFSHLSIKMMIVDLHLQDGNSVQQPSTVNYSPT
ncbi:Interferon-induced, double-stranded RNA-activated protein kinase [Folsomia candida]|uniref:Interferon-induced, double-stranded RNA-activated protein kinase n=1 Tax=Folsomia candida TaxID=158441 RepID=A0A226EF51_FOLCA|nr:Interferon-induced, double-stranded RNA-activated protein kinase [Folsomia candida]